MSKKGKDTKPAVKVLGLEMCNTSRLTPSDKLPPVEPSDTLVQNVRSMGTVIQSLVVRPDKSKRNKWDYDVLGGSRRLKALRICGITTAPILIIEGSDAVIAAATTLTENNVRSRNILADITSIRTLVKEGMTREQINEAWGIPIALIDARLELWNTLILPLREMMGAGYIHEGIAKAAARLDIKQQRKLVALVESTDLSKKRITIADVNKLREVDVDKSLASLSEDIFTKPATSDKEVSKWRKQVAKTKWDEVDASVLQQIMALLQ